MNRLWTTAIPVLTLLLSDGVGSAEGVSSLDTVNPAQWGIHNDCITTSRIRHIDFIDDRSAIITMTGDRKILMTMRKKCHGIKSRGFLHTTRNDKLCAKFDTLRVLEYGSICGIKSLEPFLELEKTQPLESGEDGVLAEQHKGTNKP